MRIVGLLFVISIATASGATVGVARAADDNAPRTCADQATTKGLTGERRQTFLKTCRQGALAPARPTTGKSKSAQAKIITAPSGADRTKRSAACSAEARRRHLDDNQAKAFRLNCLASAAPVSATGGADRPPAPTAAKPGYDTLPR
jgi:hypothetical protein